MEDKCVIIKESELKEYQDLEYQLRKLKDIEQKYNEIKDKHPELTIRFNAYIKDYKDWGFARSADVYCSSFEIVNDTIDIGGNMRDLIVKVKSKLNEQFNTWRNDYVNRLLGETNNRLDVIKYNYEIVKKENRKMREAIERHNKNVWFNRNKITWD